MVFNREFLLELLVLKNGVASDEGLFDIMERIYESGIKPDWWKLFSKNRHAYEKISSLIKEKDAYCRGLLLSSFNEPLDEFKDRIALLRKKTLPIVKGFAVGESIFFEPIKDFYFKKTNREQAKNKIKKNYESVIEFWKRN